MGATSPCSSRREQQPRRAASCGCPRTPPTRRRPGGGPGSAPRRPAAGPRRAARARTARGGGRSRRPRARRRSCARRRPADRGRRPAAAACRGSSRAPTGTAGRRSGTRGPCCGGWSAPAPPRRRIPGGGCAPRRRCPCSASAIRRAQPGGQRRRAELLLGRGGVQQLADVAQVGQPPLAVVLGEHPRRQPSASGDRLQQRGHAAHRAAPAPSRAAAGGPPPTPSRRRSARREPLGATSRRTASARRQWARVIEAGRSSASSSRSQSRAGSVANTLPAPLITAGTPPSSSASRTIAAWRLVAHEHGEVAGADRGRSARSAPCSRPSASRLQQRDDVGGQVARRCARGAGLLAKPSLGQRDRRVLAHRDADAQRRGDRRAASAASAGGRSAARTWR